MLCGHINLSRNAVFDGLLQHIGACKTSLAANHTFEMCKTAMQWLRLRKKYDMLFHSLKFKEFKSRFTILCKVLESKSSNNRDILLEGTQQLVRIKEMFEL